MRKNVFAYFKWHREQNRNTKKYVEHPNTPHPFYMKGVNCIEQHKKPKEESPIQIRRNKLRTWFKYTISVPHTRAREKTWTVTKNGSNKKHIFTLTALAKVISMLCWQWFENVRHTFFSNILHQPKKDLHRFAHATSIYSNIFMYLLQLLNCNFDDNLDSNSYSYTDGKKRTFL